MTPRRQRMVLVLAIVIGVSAAAFVGLRAFNENLLYFRSTSQVIKGDIPDNQRFRVGGLIVEGSVQRTPGSLTVNFEITDTATVLPVVYSGVLPNLFKEGQGIVAHGKLDDRGIFVADEILAKHDENYMPPDVEDSVRAAHEEGVKRAKAEAAAEEQQ